MVFEILFKRILKFAVTSLKMNDPAAEQRGIYKGNETPQAAGNYPSFASGGLN
jgi:hypothetical protein